MDRLVRAMQDVLQKQSRKDARDHVMMGSSYTPIPFSTEYFHPLSPLPSDGTLFPTPILSDTHASAVQLVFIDGGNTTLYSSAGFVIGIIKVAGVGYTGMKRIARETFEFFIMIHEDQTKLVIQTFPQTPFDGLSFNPEDIALRSGIERANGERIISVIRRLAELDYARLLQEKYSPFAIILDGTLESRHPCEEEYLARLIASGNICALSKTCSLTTLQGHALTTALYTLQPQGAWYYYPIVTHQNAHHPAKLYALKLHPKTSHVFRFEVCNNFIHDITQLCSMLVMQSTDSVFLGYPYGLIDADTIARITEEEKKMQQTRLMILLGKDWNEFSKRQNSMNAHEILDKIKF